MFITRNKFSQKKKIKENARQNYLLLTKLSITNSNKIIFNNSKKMQKYHCNTFMLFIHHSHYIIFAPFSF